VIAEKEAASKAIALFERFTITSLFVVESEMPQGSWLYPSQRSHESQGPLAR